MSPRGHELALKYEKAACAEAGTKKKQWPGPQIVAGTSTSWVAALWQDGETDAVCPQRSVTGAAMSLHSDLQAHTVAVQRLHTRLHTPLHTPPHTSPHSHCTGNVQRLYSDCAAAV